MAPDSPTDDTGLSELEAQIRECFGRVVYSTKTHEKCADNCMGRLRRIKIIQIALSALTTGGLVTVLLGSANVSQAAAVTATLLSTALLVVNAYTKDVDPGRQAETHKKTATELWNVRESYLSMLTDLHVEHVNLVSMRKQRDELQAALVAIYASAPRTTGKAYGQASKGLKQSEELTFSDEEIDKFLPAKLRKASDAR
jgi:hypothetical protein